MDSFSLSLRALTISENKLEVAANLRALKELTNLVVPNWRSENCESWAVTAENCQYSRVLNPCVRPLTSHDNAMG